MHGTVMLCLCVCAVAVADADGRLISRTGQRQRGSRNLETKDVPAHTGSRSRCLVNGIALFDGSVWSTEPCSKCQCHRGVTNCRPIPCASAEAHRDKRLTQSTGERMKVRTGKKNERNAVGKRAVEPKHKTPETAADKVTQAKSIAAGRQLTSEGKKQEVGTIKEVKGVKLAPVAQGTRGRVGGTQGASTKLQNEKERFTSKYDDYDDDDDDDDDDNDDFRDFERLLGPVPSPSHRTGFMESLPTGCLLSDSVIACGSTGMAHFPIITDLGVKTLYLAENKIRKIPPRALAGLPNLEWLDLSKNKLDDFSFSPDLFRNLTKLKRLNLDGNNLTKIPPLPPSLEELKINDNKIISLTPNSFKGLSKLLTLELEDNHLHDGNVSPLTFRPLRKLIYLRLDENKFRAIPSGLPPSLQELRLSENRVEEVQVGILNKTVNLTVLDLSHNRIREDRIDPRAWIHLLNLEALDLSHNKLVHVPSFLPAGLLQLSLHHNQIERIPGYVFGHLRTGLESLRLSHNHLRHEGMHAASFVGLQHSLTELLLDHNQLRSVPRGLLQLKALQVLRLDHNLISDVPLNSICDTSASEDSPLVSVHLENNLIDRRLIPPTAFSCIRSYHSVQLRPQREDDSD